MLFEFLAGAGSIAVTPILSRVPDLSPYLARIIFAGLVLVVDSIGRYQRRLAEDPYPYGFYEWPFGRKEL